MKRSFKSILGVTLLEIMLVLAVAAMIVVMSVRYYQSATMAQQTGVVLQQNLNLIAAMDGLVQGPNDFTNINTAMLNSTVGSTEMTNQWGGSVTLSAQGANVYTLTETNLPSSVCTSVMQKLKANTRVSGSVACNAGTAPFYNLSYTYNKTL